MTQNAKITQCVGKTYYRHVVGYLQGVRASLAKMFQTL